MDLKIISGIIALAIVAMAIGMLLPVNLENSPSYLPWEIETGKHGTSQVFGLTLDQSRLIDAENNFRTSAELSLFSNNGENYVVEAYFDKLTLAGLNAKMTLVIAVNAELLPVMFARGSRISNLGNGTKKVTLNAQDSVQVRDSVISSITYLPSTRLQADVIEQRFGKPAQLITESDSGMRHWLYPELGLDISLNADGNAVFQYISPARFTEITAPLLSK